MARCFATSAIACVLLGNLVVGTSSEFAEPQPVEDSEALVQTVARVQQQPVAMGGPSEKLLRGLATMQAKIMARQEKAMTDLQQKVVSKLQAKLNGTNPFARKLQQSGPSAEEQARIQKAKEEWEARLELERQQEKAEEEAQAMEAKKAKYGEAMTYIVRDPLGRETKIQFRGSTRLRVLKSAISKRLGLPLSEVNFTYADEPLPSNETPETIGMVENDVIEVNSEDLQHELRAKEAAERIAAKEAELKAQEKQRELDWALKKAQVRMAKAKEAEKVQKKQKKDRDLKKSDKVLLKFVNKEGKEISLAFKKNNRMGPLAVLVSKRFGLDASQISLHYGPEDKEIRFDDTARSLDFMDTEIIKVKEN